MHDSPSVSRTAARWLGALLLAAGSVVLSAQTPPLTLVSTAWSPFTNEPGQPRFALDLVEAALGRFGVNAKTTIVSAAEFTPSLLGGRFDGSAAAWKDPERERALIFSQPYLENRLVLVGRHGADVSAKGARRSHGQARRARRRLFVRRRDRHGGPRSGAIAAARKTAWRACSKGTSTTR